MPARHRTAAVSLAALALFASGCGTESGASSPAEPRTAGPVTVLPGLTIEPDPRLHAKLPETVRAAGTVRVATDVPYPPFEMYTKEGSTRITGIDYDLGQAIGARLGVEFEFKAQKFDGILPAVQAGKFDAVMSAMTDKKARQKSVDFVDYLNAGPGWLVKKGNPEKIAVVTDVCGKPVGVQTGTNHQKLLQQRQELCKAKGLPPIEILAFSKDSEAQLALRSGKVIADYLDEVTAAYVASTADGGTSFSTVTGRQAVGEYSASPMGIGVSKDHPGLKEAVRAALQSLMDDGSYRRILMKYQVPGIGIAEATVNGALD
ncbi:ABC transporter substrate-binding protein [Streptomyces litmocidini]|uniref:ABC transporter substrate-binding protein n=1 Tax=Streptomyces litmocidini TaxID=67318 RepID=UPI00167CC7C4|nr:ABC transporter substrate-binding protein [Streptomyces litmocidini]GGV00240.1 ABC transporter substrate-binding protein [Streptomyces litmocidini]